MASNSSAPPKVGALIYTRGDRPQFLAQAISLLDRQSIQPAVRYVIDHPPKSNNADLVERVREGVTRAIQDSVTHLFFLGGR